MSRTMDELFPIVKPYTMSWYRNRRGGIKHEKLDAIYDICNRIVAENIPGDYIELGVYAGGSSAIAGEVLRNTDKHLWLFDSWEGLPEPTTEDVVNKSMKKDEVAKAGMCKASIDQVKEVMFKKMELPENKVTLCQGWFKDTFPIYENYLHQRKICLLNIDCDFYDPYKLVLETFFDDVVPGGYVYVDDYGYWDGCKKAMHEFFDKRNFHPKLIPTDKIGVYFQLPK